MKKAKKKPVSKKKSATKAKKKTVAASRKAVKTKKKVTKKVAASRKTVKTKKKVTKKVATSRKKKKVLAIPKGYSSVTPYLIVSHGISAIEFYKKIFGAKEMLRMQHSGNKIGHAELKIGDSKFMLADECSESGARNPRTVGGTPVLIHLYIKDVDAVVSRAVAAGSRLVRPVENMFYGDRCGLIEDPYGHMWNVATHVEDVSPRETRKRAEKLFGQ